VRDVSYEHLAITSDVICVGTVESVLPVAPAPPSSPGSLRPEQPFAVAMLNVEQLWKGPEGQSKVAFLGSSTWTCDITGAEVGERVLVLLKRWSEEQRKGTVWKSDLDALLGEEPFYSVCWAGRGELRVLPGEGEKPPRVDFEWLPWTGESKFISLPELRERTQRILAANSLGTVKHPTTKEPALAAILRQEMDSNGTLHTTVVAALFDQGQYDACYWSAAPSGAGAPFLTGSAKAGFGPVYGCNSLAGAGKFLDPPAIPGTFEGTRELIVIRDPMFSMTSAGTPLAKGAPKPEGAGAAERLLWNEMRRRILSVMPEDSRDARDVKLELGG
jgi:hypothetical protein